MLDTIPPEVLGLVAYHLSIESLQPPTKLLLASKHFNECLSPKSNPNLYARIFRESFDTSAASRRSTAELTARGLTDELEKRVRALGRLRELLENGRVGEVKDEDLWVIYILLVEHDKKNMSHLFTEHFNLLKFLKAYYTENLLVGAVEPGYPDETVGRSLVMWIAWILHTQGIGREEDQEEEDERLFVLRPYVFAAQKYELYFGPWTIHDLPLATSSFQQPLGTEFVHPFKADLKPKSRGVVIRYYGEEVRLSPPVLSHAAILRFFKRDYDEDEDDDEEEDEDIGEVEHNGEEREVVRPFESLAGLVSQPGFASQTTRTGINLRGIHTSSTSHDRDWTRLTSCYDASTSKGMKVRDWRNAFEGCWEGNFSFFEFEAFKQMLAGHSRALYEGPFGEQAQVWRLTETYIWPIGSKLQVAPVEEEDVDMTDESGRKDKGKEKEKPFSGPATNAGFPEDLPSSTSAGLATPSAEQITLQETIKQQVEAIEGYEVIPHAELDAAIDNGAEGLEVLLTGTGHSAWGRFILKGRVRAWDGMATLVKEYAPDSRGRWVYRGYVTAGDVFVGRWRDTFTPEEFYGYEGTFILNRRT